MSLQITYKIEGAGWAKASFRDGDFYHETRVSYMDDTLESLALAAIAIRDGEPTAQVDFLPEPGALHLVLENRDDTLHYELHWFFLADDFGHYDPKQKPEILHQGEIEAWDFVCQVRKLLHSILRQHGMEGYKKLWIEDEFPIDHYNNLFSKSG
jgi:hypothetical protein